MSHRKGLNVSSDQGQLVDTRQESDLNVRYKFSCEWDEGFLMKKLPKEQRTERF